MVGAGEDGGGMVVVVVVVCARVGGLPRGLAERGWVVVVGEWWAESLEVLRESDDAFLRLRPPMSLWARYTALPPRRRVLLGMIGLGLSGAGLLISPKPADPMQSQVQTREVPQAMGPVAADTGADVGAGKRSA
jgi:hypothetical protein